MITYEQAKKYLSKGWSIFPVVISWNTAMKKYEKKPAVSWKIYQERRPTKKELHTWFDIPRYNGIGLVTGKISNVVVIDVDDKKSPEGLYSPLVSKTISGGRHYYFRWSEKIQNTVRIDNSPIDFRGDGGFVVLPPSKHGENLYIWEKEIESMYLSELPEIFKKYLQKKKISVITRQKLSFTGLPIANKGNRNATAASVVGKILRSVLPKHHETIGLLAFCEWNQTHVNPPLEDPELMTTWSSILGKYRREEPVSSVEVLGIEDIKNKYNQITKSYGDGLTTGFSVLDKYFKFIPQQLYLISAATHQGKTTLGLNIAVRVAQTGASVLFASLEQGVFIYPRILSMNNNRYPQSLKILDSEQMIVISQLVKTVENMDVKPKLIIIDHLHFIKKTGNKATIAIDNMMAEIQAMAKRLKLPVVIIAHVRKLNSDRTPEMDDLRDSSSLSQIPSVVLLLHRKRSDEVFADLSYLSPYGVLFVAKNRIQGKTGVVSFQLKNSGIFEFKEGEKK